MYNLKQKRKFGKETYHLSSVSNSIESEPILEHSAEDWRDIGYKARVVKNKKFTALYLKPKPKLRKD